MRSSKLSTCLFAAALLAFLPARSFSTSSPTTSPSPTPSPTSSPLSPSPSPSPLASCGCEYPSYTPGIGQNVCNIYKQTGSCGCSESLPENGGPGSLCNPDLASPELCACGSLVPEEIVTCQDTNGTCSLDSQDPAYGSGCQVASTTYGSGVICQDNEPFAHTVLNTAEMGDCGQQYGQCSVGTCEKTVEIQWAFDGSISYQSVIGTCVSQ